MICRMEVVTKMAVVSERMISVSVTVARSREPVCSQTIRKTRMHGATARMPSPTSTMMISESSSAVLSTVGRPVGQRGEAPSG